MQTKKLTLFIVSLLVLLTLNGCASSVDVAKQLDNQTVLLPQEGILVARVVNATSYRLPYNQLFIAAKDVNASQAVKPVLIESQEKPIGGSTLFSVTLKPGEYSLSAVRSFIFRGEFYYSRGTPSDPEFGTFKVEPGKVTDLGTIVYYPKPADEMYQDMIVRVPETANGDVIKKYFPKIAASHNEFLTWEEDDREEQRFLTYASIAQNPLNYTKTLVAPDGSVYMLGKLGVILRYKSDEGFELLGVDTELDLSSFAQNNAGARIVGGHEGALFFQRPDNEWQKVDLPENVTVHHVSFYQENQFDVTYSTKNKVSIVRFDNENLLPTATLNQYTYRHQWNQDLEEVKNTSKVGAPVKTRKIKHIDHVSVIIDDDGLGEINISSYTPQKWSSFGNGSSDRYAFNQSDWEMNPFVENDEKMDVTFDAGAVTLGLKRAGFWSWSGKPDYFIATDSNAKWQPISTGIKYCKGGGELRSETQCMLGKNPIKPSTENFSFLSAPWFWDQQNGLAIVSFSDYSLWSGQRSSETKIVRTENAGKTWQKTELTLPKDYCTTIVNQVIERILLSCEGASTDFYESTDQGQTWQHVRQQQAF